MTILNKRVGFLSNYEVLKHLKELKNNESDNFYTSIRFKKFTNDICNYFNKIPSITLDIDFKNMIESLNKYDLTKVEKLQILNFLPKSMVMLHSLIEECDQRFDENTCESILNEIKMVLKLKDENDEQKD